ncbi:MAG: hypothetical protein JST88_09740, partial [Bacteroidetes bacterium]|nr:hypothetical protein [Bacteroidota bacterium]
MFSPLWHSNNSTIAENAKAWAKVRTQNWLTLYDGRQFTNTILWPQPEPMMRKIPSTQSLETKIFPNPAHEYLTINYQNSTEKGALLQVTDIIGRTVLSQPLEGL